MLGAFIYQKDPKNALNKIYLLMCALLEYLAIGEYGFRQATDVASASMWLTICSVWHFAMAIYMHFALVFTGKTTILHKKMAYFLLYVPAFSFTIIELMTDAITGEPIKEHWGWTYTAPDTVMYTINDVWTALLMILPLGLCFVYFLRANDFLEKRRATYVFSGMVILAAVALVTEGIFLARGIRVLDLILAASAVKVVIISYGIYKYNIFALTPAVAADDIVAGMSNILFLVQRDKTISLVNKSAQTLLGYTEPELKGQPLQCIFEEKEWEKIEKYSNSLAAPYTGETTVTTKDKRTIPVLLSISAVHDKNNNILGIVCVGSDLTDRKRAEEAQKKELLLKEIHHRVKNNMQIISSLLSLQSRYITDEPYISMFKESQNRIRSMALVHEKLYQSKDLENINLHDYITDMAHRLVRSYSGYNINLEIEAEDICMEVDTAVPCGLIINELVSNSLKHAFPDGKGEIKVGFYTCDDVTELVVADNGVGIPEDMDFRKTETLGLHLVTILVEDQLRGKIRLSRDKGTKFCITFGGNTVSS